MYKNRGISLSNSVLTFGLTKLCHGTSIVETSSASLDKAGRSEHDKLTGPRSPMY